MRARRAPHTARFDARGGGRLCVGACVCAYACVRIEREEDEMEEAAMEVFVDHEENFKTAFTSSNWNTIADGNRPIESRGREMARSRSSPSPSPFMQHEQHSS